MGEIDYTKLEWGNQIFCPHCGKLLKPKNHTVATGCGLGSWDCDPEYTTYQTYKCPDCGIKATTRDYSISDPAAWKFPKNYEVTVTQSQINYITFLASHFHNIVRDVPIITDKKLAAIWISQFVQELDKENQIQIYEQKIENLFKDIGFKFIGYDMLPDNSQKDHNIMKFSHLEYSHNHDYPGSFYTYLYFYKDTHEIKFGLEISYPDYCKDETDAIAMADRDCNSIEEFIDNYDRLQDVVSTFQLCMMKQVNIYNVLHAKDYQEWLHMPAPLNIVDKEGTWHEDQVLTEDEFDQIRKYLTVYK